MAGSAGGERDTKDTRADASERQRLAAQRVGLELKGWRLEKLLGVGPVAATYEARAGEERGVVKVLDDDLAHDEVARTQFLRAAYAANRFRHARVVPVTQDGATSEATFVVRPWQEARPLAEVVRARVAEGAEPNTDVVLRMAEQLLDVLEMAHTHGLVHGAISPDNLLLTPAGSVRLCDFAVGPATSVSADGKRGRLAARRDGPFVAPECRASMPTDASRASNLWSVAACMYFALAGSPPEFVETDGALAPKVRPLHELSSTTREHVARIVEHGLELEPANRYDSAYAMLGDVRRAMAGREPKLEGALRPVPSGNYAELAPRDRASSMLPPLGAADLIGATDAASKAALLASLSAARGKAATAPRSERRGNVALALAIAVLLGVATFVLVREKLADHPPAPSSSPPKLYH